MVTSANVGKRSDRIVRNPITVAVRFRNLTSCGGGDISWAGFSPVSGIHT